MELLSRRNPMLADLDTATAIVIENLQVGQKIWVPIIDLSHPNILDIKGGHMTTYYTGMRSFNRTNLWMVLSHQEVTTIEGKGYPSPDNVEVVQVEVSTRSLNHYIVTDGKGTFYRFIRAQHGGGELYGGFLHTIYFGEAFSSQEHSDVFVNQPGIVVVNKGCLTVVLKPTIVDVVVEPSGPTIPINS